jgi:hypothetical protein
MKLNIKGKGKRKKLEVKRLKKVRIDKKQKSEPGGFAS